ncbi:MAG: type Z 30S ribosomal protein S14 [Chloroflexi bacterium]|nr:type Z 30S ribosomal protein S14 [Chloroflexota bacterium]MCL5946684.1 type Z 30S ribosomal protein S14 [Chloroflexota bacterium]
MARKAMIAAWQKKPKYQVQFHNRCRACGRPRAYMRQFALCRICFRDMANRGELPGITKSSW